MTLARPQEAKFQEAWEANHSLPAKAPEILQRLRVVALPGREQ